MYSPSGAGKTSLIQASVIPAMKDEDFHVLPLVRPGLIEHKARCTARQPLRGPRN